MAGLVAAGLASSETLAPIPSPLVSRQTLRVCGGRVREGGRATLESIILQARPQFIQLQSNGFQYAIDVVENLVIGEPQNAVALRDQGGRARSVPRDFRIG